MLKDTTKKAASSFPSGAGQDGAPIKVDIRVRKTNLAIKNAALMLLNRSSFSQITVNNICTEALISRAAFYAHFNNKYDLLRSWLNSLIEVFGQEAYQYEALEEKVNKFVYDNQRIIKNLIKDADHETLDLLRDFVIQILMRSIKSNSGENAEANQTLLLNFCAGGLIQHLLWHVKNNFPSGTKFMNSYIYEMLRAIIDWDAAHK